MNTFSFKIEDRNYEISVDMQNDNSAVVYVNGAKFNIAIEDGIEETSSDIVANKTEPCKICDNFVSSSTILSPIPGVLLYIKVRVGERVKKGQILAVVEAMKMENDIVSEQDGIVRTISASSGDTLMEGSPIMIIDNL